LTESERRKHHQISWKYLLQFAIFAEFQKGWCLGQCQNSGLVGLLASIALQEVPGYSLHAPCPVSDVAPEQCNVLLIQTLYKWWLMSLHLDLETHQLPLECSPLSSGSCGTMGPDEPPRLACCHPVFFCQL